MKNIGNDNYLPCANTRFTFLLNNAISSIADYAVASTATAAFIIGGYNPDHTTNPATRTTLSTVAEFSQLPSESAGSWKLRGNLQNARTMHQTITYLGQTLVIGGGGFGNVGRFVLKAKFIARSTKYIKFFVKCGKLRS